MSGPGRSTIWMALAPSVILAALGLGGCGGKDTPGPSAAISPVPPAAKPDPYNLGSHTYKVTTPSADAQRSFDRGLTLAYGFSHAVAEREFRKAAEQDPKLAMAWWGVALVNGPHINFPLVPPDKAKIAWEALGKARSLAAGAGETERALIDALGKRYADPQPEDRHLLDEAYAAAMRDVWKAHPQDADVATLFAEAMMDLRPWDLYTQDGKPQPGTEEIAATLERAMRIDPRHPGANHLYIHVVEASPEPAKGVPAADLLRDLVPGSSHFVHMPSHIYARVGRWKDASDANTRAMAADAVYRAANPNPGLYGMYMAHNQQFFTFAAMMRGMSAGAVTAARASVAGTPADFVKDYAMIADGYLAIVPEVLMRFGKWEEILKEREPAEILPLSRALWRFARAASLTALGRADEAKKERAAFQKAAAAVPKDWPCGNNTAADILSIAANLLDGEIAAKQNKLDEAVKRLREAVRVEDRLKYNEPPDWLQPVRHTLGAVLLRAKKYSEAETVYREDLARSPENGWALYGLGRALRLQKKDAEAEGLEARFKVLWHDADVTLDSTCYCQPGV